MIPSADDILDGYPFVARRLGTTLPASRAAVFAAVETARVLAAGEEQDEPAALFYAFATHRRAFPGACRRMVEILTLNQARALGYRLDAQAHDVEAIKTAVMYREAPFDVVRAWFAARLAPH